MMVSCLPVGLCRVSRAVASLMWVTSASTYSSAGLTWCRAIYARLAGIAATTDIGCTRPKQLFSLLFDLRIAQMPELIKSSKDV